MGFNTVAVLYNDHTHRLRADDGTISQEIGRAMQHWSMRDRDRLATHFGAGMVVSQAHADCTQIVAVGQNRGRPIQDCDDLDYITLSTMAECLIRHGWTAKPPSKPKRKRAVAQSNGDR